MSDFDGVAYLAGKGIRGKPVSGGREITYPCFFDCEEPTLSAKRKLYLNVAEGFYNCKVCNASGGSWMLQKHFGDEPRSGSTDDAFMRRRILDGAVAAGETMLSNNDDAMLYLLRERGLTDETIIQRRLGFVAGSWSLVGVLPEEATPAQLKTTGLIHREGPRAGRDFFYRHLLIPYLSRGHCIQMRGRIWGEISGGKYMTGPGEPVRMYNADALEGADEAIICEGEFDAMILAQTLAASPDPRARKIAVVGLAGTNAIPDDFDDLLSDVKRIYFGFDSDDAGKKATETLSERIGPRARVLTLPYDDGRKCDWTEYLLPSTGVNDWANRHPYAGHTANDVLRLMSTASGKRIFSIAEAGLAYRAYRQAHGGLRTGYLEFDETVNPGLLPGQVVIILAKTGAGKTLLLCNLAYQMRSHRILFVSLEMTREEVYERLRRIYLFHHPTDSDYAIDQALANVFICDENRLADKDLERLVEEFTVEADGRPDIVMVDYLGYYARGARGNSPYEKVANAVMQLKAAAKTGRFVVFSPAQVNRGAKEGKPIDLDDARDAGQVEETADFLLALYRPDDGLDPEGDNRNQMRTGRMNLELLKSRHGGKGKKIDLQMDELTLAIVSDRTAESDRARRNTKRSMDGMTWDALRAEQLAPVQLEVRYGK